MVKDYPKLYENKIDCCGCGACMAICSSNAISMKMDNEGFVYPVVNFKLCIKCYMCINTCMNR